MRTCSLLDGLVAVVMLDVDLLGDMVMVGHGHRHGSWKRCDMAKCRFTDI